MNIAAPLFAAPYACVVNIGLTAAKLPMRLRSNALACRHPGKPKRSQCQGVAAGMGQDVALISRSGRYILLREWGDALIDLTE